MRAKAHTTEYQTKIIYINNKILLSSNINVN